MAGQTVLVVGAAGTVGRGIVAAALASGRNVVAAGHTEGRAEALRDRFPGAALACLTGDISSEAGAAALWNAAIAPFGGVDHVVVSVNVPVTAQPLLDFSADDLERVLVGNTMTHFNAARTFLPLLPAHGRLIGIGGGTADFVFPGMAHVSMAQAALRMMYRGLARETGTAARAQELMIVAMVAGESDRDTAPGDWITNLEVGRHLCAILDAPDDFARPVLHLRSRQQIGLPEADG